MQRRKYRKRRSSVDKLAVILAAALPVNQVMLRPVSVFAKASRDTIHMLGLDDRISHKPRELSGGQQQRVAIARALVGEPSILLADEPTGALDQNSGRDVLKLFHRLNEMGNTIVMITHDLNVAKNAERIVQIVDGELRKDTAE